MAAHTSIRDIHVVVDLGGERRSVSFAADLARSCEAHLTGVAFAFQPIIPVYTMAAPVPTDFIVSAQENAVAEAEAAGRKFEEIADGAGALYASRIIDSMPGDGFGGAVRSLTLTDLTVVGQQDPDRLEPMREGLIEALLFQASVPVMLVPHTGTKTFQPDRVLVAWDRGPVAARAVRSAMPLIGMAKHVDVVTVAEHGKDGEIAGGGIGRYLARHDVEVEIHEIERHGHDIGHAIADFATERKSDWMVMGAYGHNRMREFFLGGATRSLLASARIPIYLSH